MLDTLKLGFNVLLRDLQQAKDTVVSLLRNHVQNVAKPLGAALPPSLVHAEGHVLGAIFPTEQLNVCLALVNAFCVVKPGAWEDADDLGKLDDSLREGSHAMLEVLKGLLVDLRVK